MQSRSIIFLQATSAATTKKTYQHDGKDQCKWTQSIVFTDWGLLSLLFAQSTGLDGYKFTVVCKNHLLKAALVWLQMFPFCPSLNKDFPIGIDGKFNLGIGGAKIHSSFLHSVIKGKVSFGGNSYSSYIGINGHILDNKETKSWF